MKEDKEAKKEGQGNTMHCEVGGEGREKTKVGEFSLKYGCDGHPWGAPTGEVIP